MVDYIHGETDAVETARLERQARFFARWLLEGIELGPGSRLLDLACGTGSSSLPSEPLLFVGHVHQRLTGGKAPDVFREHAKVPPGNAWRGAGNVRCEDDLRELPKRVIGRKRLHFIHVKTSAGEVARP